MEHFHVDFCQRLRSIRINCELSQVDFAQKIGISHRTLVMYEAGERFPNAETLFQINKITNVNFNWLITGEGFEDSLDPTFVPYFDVLKIVCPNLELEKSKAEVLDEMKKVLNNKIAKYLVNNLLQDVRDLPLFDKIKGFIIMTDFNTTMKIWNIIKQASDNKSNISAKEKLVIAAKNGFFLNKFMDTQIERDLIANLVEMWPDDVCDFLLQHSDTIIQALKQLSPAANEAISNQTKVLKLKNILKGH